MFLVSNESGMIAGLDSATFGYVAVFLALIVYLGGGMLGSYSGRAGAMLRDFISYSIHALATPPFAVSSTRIRST